MANHTQKRVHHNFLLFFSMGKTLLQIKKIKNYFRFFYQMSKTKIAFLCVVVAAIDIAWAVDLIQIRQKKCLNSKSPSELGRFFFNKKDSSLMTQ